MSLLRIVIFGSELRKNKGSQHNVELIEGQSNKTAGKRSFKQIDLIERVDQLDWFFINDLYLVY